MSEQYEPGRYKARVVSQGFGRERSGTEFFYMTVRPTKRVYDDYDEDVAYLGDRDVKLHLTDKTIDFQLEILRSLGWGGVDFEELFSGDHSFIGQDLDLSCDQREYKGKYYDQFAIWQVGGTKQVEPSAVASLTSKFADKLRETAKDLPKRESEPVVAADDEIPF